MWTKPSRFDFAAEPGNTGTDVTFSDFETWGQTGSFPFSEVSSHYEPSESCETNIRKRPVCPRVPTRLSPSSHRESFRASVLSHSSNQAVLQSTAAKKCLLTTPSLLSRGTQDLLGAYERATRPTSAAR